MASQEMEDDIYDELLEFKAQQDALLEDSEQRLRVV
jgi:hypothetical protein